MKNKKQLFIYVLILFLILFLIVLLSIAFNGTNILNTNNSEETPINTEVQDISINYTTSELSGETSEYNAKIYLSDDNTKIEGSGAQISGTNIKIQKGGTYYFTGSISNACIEVDTSKNDEVGIVLDNANITSKTTSAINGIACKKLTITLAENSINNVADSSSYTGFSDTEKSEPDGTIFTKTDLVINGTGKLAVDSNYKDGIVSKDELKIISAEIEIDSADDGISGKDYTAINNAKITINSKGDGIKSTNDEDTSLGYIAIEGGTINIKSGSDGIQAETILNISQNPVINITTSGSVSTSSNSSKMYGSISASQDNSSSSKGLKAGKQIAIENGTFTINSTDDSIHSNDSVIINGGTFNITSGDDGIHSDTSLVINNGNIDIKKSYEGIESSYIEINGGDISVVASDDGINVAGGNDSSAIGGRQGQNNFSSVSNSNRKLVINNGNIKVNATGDGLDSNGSMYIYGGTILVEGPASSGNGALDYDVECVVTGGNIIAYGAGGMWQNPSATSTQYTVAYAYSGKSGDNLILKDSSGKEIANITTTKSYGGILFSNSQIQKGETYTLYANGTSVENLNVTDIITSNTGSGTGGMKGNGMNGRKHF